jgi:hypothetical protein
MVLTEEDDRVILDCCDAGYLFIPIKSAGLWRNSGQANQKRGSFLN